MGDFVLDSEGRLKLAIEGVSGYSGASGSSGFSGMVGPQGESGVSGASTSGYSGFSGTVYPNQIRQTLDLASGYSGASGSLFKSFTLEAGQQYLLDIIGSVFVSAPPFFYSGTAGYLGIDRTLSYPIENGGEGTLYSEISPYCITCTDSGTLDIYLKTDIGPVDYPSTIELNAGANAFSGYSGLSSQSGFSGAVGISGTSGAVGASGSSGFSGMIVGAYDFLRISSGISGASETTGTSGFKVPIEGYSMFVSSGTSVNVEGQFATSGFSAFDAEDNVWRNVPSYGMIYPAFFIEGPSGYGSAVSSNTDYVDSGNTRLGYDDTLFTVTQDGWIKASYLSPSREFVLTTEAAENHSGVSGQAGYIYPELFIQNGFIGSGSSGFSGVGFSGPAGASGASGWSGVSGPTGSGLSGTSGRSGYSGPSGISGWSGVSGPVGASGYSGFSGAFSGISGYSGTTGVSGFSGSAAGIPFGLNILDNSNMSVSQRIRSGYTFTAADGVYGAADRWYSLTQSGNTTTSIETGVDVQTLQSLKVLQAHASDQRFGIAQVIPQTKSTTLRGRDIQLAYDIYQSSGGNATMRHALLWWDGTADTVTKDVVNDWTSGTFTTGNFFTNTNISLIKTGSNSVANTTWTRITETISSAEMGAVNSSNYNLILFIWFEDAQAQNNFFQITAVDLYEGWTSRNYSPKDPVAEHLECCRYVQGFHATSGERISIAMGQATANSSIQFYWNYIVPLRTHPTLTISSGFSLSTYIPAATAVKNLTLTSISADSQIRKHGQRFTCNVQDSAATAGQSYLIYTNNATGYFLLNADL